MEADEIYLDGLLLFLGILCMRVRSWFGVSFWAWLVASCDLYIVWDLHTGVFCWSYLVSMHLFDENIGVVLL